MCTLVPNLVGVSENIQVTSIIDRYLEHDRVYIFENGGDTRVYLSSADWMTRNIDYRIEVAVAILDPTLKQRILDIIEILLSDTARFEKLIKDDRAVHENKTWRGTFLEYLERVRELVYPITGDIMYVEASNLCLHFSFRKFDVLKQRTPEYLVAGIGMMIALFR